MMSLKSWRRPTTERRISVAPGGCKRERNAVKTEEHVGKTWEKTWLCLGKCMKIAGCFLGVFVDILVQMDFLNGPDLLRPLSEGIKRGEVLNLFGENIPTISTNISMKHQQLLHTVHQTPP